MTESLDFKTLHTTWHYPTRIIFGAGAAKDIASYCETLSIKRPLLVTDRGLATFDFIQNIHSSVENSTLFSDVDSNPTGSNIAEGVLILKNNHCDGVIAIGGGSAIDAGKTIALMAGQSRPIWDFEDIGDNHLRVNEAGMLPTIAVPTTAGTGSEVGRASVILDEDVSLKKIIFHAKMLPELVIADPELTLPLPAKLTAATGIDAFVHSFEAYCAPGYHPMADGIAVESMQLIKRWLPVAFQNGSHLEARSHLLVAASMGATAFQKGLGAVHALAHPLGAIYNAHHGLLNAILLPYVVKANRLAIASKVQELCMFLKIEDIGNTKENSYEKFLAWIISFKKELNIPHCLKDIGIEKKQITKIAELACRDPSASTNPIPFNVEQYENILTDAIEGNL